MAGPDTNKLEFVEMARRASSEIKQLRQQIAHLQPKAEAYYYLTTVLRLVPDQRSRTMGEDLAWALDKRIAELTKGDKPDASTGEEN